MRKLSSRAVEAGFTLEKSITGYAYPRNGNAHNPTPRVIWQLRNATGEVLDCAYKQADLVESAEALLDEASLA